jgi:hypothetical protein
MEVEDSTGESGERCWSPRPDRIPWKKSPALFERSQAKLNISLGNQSLEHHPQASQRAGQGMKTTAGMTVVPPSETGSQAEHTDMNAGFLHQRSHLTICFLTYLRSALHTYCTQS